MTARRSSRSAGLARIFAIVALYNITLPAVGFEPVQARYWTEHAVRKVLHTFAFGGHASEAQIASWAAMDPRVAIEEILSFAPVNTLLSPAEDETASHAASLAGLQGLWSTDDASNRVCPDRRWAFSVTRDTDFGEVALSNTGLQNTWIQAVKTRGINPFRQRVGLWLTNYHMAVSLASVTAPLVRDLYDNAMAGLADGRPFHEILAIGATDAAIAYQYGHRNNAVLRDGSFVGNDDFAREFHQLFFRVKGAYEDPDYHENVTIEGTARALTGMQLDVLPFAYGATRPGEWWIGPIDFTDHTDGAGRMVANTTRHHGASLEILGRPIMGATAYDKITQLAAAEILEPESLENLPVAIVAHFADDNLTPDKIAEIRSTWRGLVGQPDDLLMFLREYAISTAFHREDTVKYRTAFDRNMTMLSLLTLDNDDAYGSPFNPLMSWLVAQGAVPFVPAHAVFGGQTSADAANSPDLFKLVYNRAVTSSEEVAMIGGYCGSEVWEKDWSKVIPRVQGGFRVDATAAYLWERFVADGHASYGELERAHLVALLATGRDLASALDRRDPDRVVTAGDLRDARLASMIDSFAAASLALDSPNATVRLNANRRVGAAVNFITALPYVMAMTGHVPLAALASQSP